MENTDALRTFYNKNPFPRVSLFASVDPADAHLLNYQAGLFASYGIVPAEAPERPRILVVGGGTFEPYVVAKGNPGAEVVALDLSERSLGSLKRRVRLHGLSGRVSTLHGDIRKPSEEWGKFHYVIATGVLHHMPDPEAALAAIDRLLLPNGIARFMVYSRHGREGVYRLKRIAQLLGITVPDEFRKMANRLPPNHPLRISFDLYTDARSDEGLNDGYFHVCDEPRDAESWGVLLGKAGFRATKFLHSPSGQPQRVDKIFGKFAENRRDDWACLGILDRSFELESNFTFFAAREADLSAQSEATGKYILNPALEGSEGRKVYSRLAGEYIPVPAVSEAEEKLIRSLFILRQEVSV